jgi:hypothetical protein
MADQPGAVTVVDRERYGRRGESGPQRQSGEAVELGYQGLNRTLGDCGRCSQEGEK